MRPIEYDERHFVPAKNGQKARNEYETKRGVFHGWITEGQINDELYAAAIIEQPDGYVVTIPNHKVRFLDTEEQ
jgi:hypothetical protein|tara:strand:+ start:859 stop:1080 length:222 start_codon:yes stop_codon:yes gene_type:complete